MARLRVIDPFSPAQIVGYVAFVLGVSAFLQKNDRRLKILNICQCTVYSVHFVLLGEPVAALAIAISAIRSLTALRTSSPIAAVVFVALNLGVGFLAVHPPSDWLPVAGACVAAAGVFVLKGVPMRLAFFTSSAFWLANNLINGSIGGMAVESFICLANIITIIRLLRAPRPHPVSGAPAGG